jgi:hypothetical protein
MNTLQMIQEIKVIIKKDENYINQNNKTIGGIWTVWGWMYKDVMFQIMDEGYTDAVAVKDKLFVYATYGRDPVFRKGNEEVLKEVLENLKKD